jgi:hypothetical protein
MRSRRIVSLITGPAMVLVCAAFPALLSPTSAASAERPSRTSTAGQAPLLQKGLVILVQFPDVQHSVERGAVQHRFFKQLNGYVQEMSYGRVKIDGDVTAKWYTLNHPISHYQISSRNLEVDRTRISNLIEDAINAAEPDTDFSKLAFVAILLGARREEYGMVGLCGYPGMLGWTADKACRTRSGKVIPGGVAIFCYDAHPGTLFHDVAHILGGVEGGQRRVPCLYDHDLQAKPGPLREAYLGALINMGYWDPMSCHYYKRNEPPPGISSWTKLRLNWIAPAQIKVVQRGETREMMLGPLEEGSSETLVIKVPVSEKTYYLIENRQPIGFDRNLPGSGVLIMYADDTIAECRHGKAPVRLIDAAPSVPQLEGAAFDIGRKESFVDEKNAVKIRLMEKIGSSYRISVSH